MPIFVPEEVIFLKLWMIDVIISAIIYGGVLSLSLSYVPLLLKTSNDISRRMRKILLVYVTLMVGFSTVYLITMIISLTCNIFGYVDPLAYSSDWFQNGLVGAVCLTFASWGADGFMLWRCAMLYEGVSRFRRITLLAVLILMALISFGSGVVSVFIQAIVINQGSRPGHFSFLIMIGITIILNSATATLITLRILYFHIYIRKTVGLKRSDSPYMTVLIICVESSALIVVFSLIYFILVFHPVQMNFYLEPTIPFDVSYLPLQLLVHVYVLSPLLIVYRVAKGKAATIRQRHSASGPVVSTVQFRSLLADNDEV